MHRDLQDPCPVLGAQDHQFSTVSKVANMDAGLNLQTRPRRSGTRVRPGRRSRNSASLIGRHTTDPAWVPILDPGIRGH